MLILDKVHIIIRCLCKKKKSNKMKMEGKHKRKKENTVTFYQELTENPPRFVFVEAATLFFFLV